MEMVLLIVQLILALGLIGIVLIQRSDSDGFGLGSGGGMNMFSSRGKATFLTRGTAILAALFIINSLALSIVAANMSDRGPLDQLRKAAEEESPLMTPASTPAADVDGGADVASPDETQTEEPAPDVQVPVAD